MTCDGASTSVSCRPLEWGTDQQWARIDHVLVSFESEAAAGTLGGGDEWRARDRGQGGEARRAM